MKIHLDDSELRNLEVDIAGAPGRIQRKAPEALRTRIGPRLKREMKIDAAGHMGNWFGWPGTEYVTPLPRHVSFEMRGQWEVEAGIESKGAGKLAHIIVYGSSNNAPVYDHTAALRRAQPFALRVLADVAEEAVLGDDL